MNIPMSWLKSYVDIDVDMKEFIEDITMSGSKVEAVVSFSKDISRVVVGVVTSIEKHPDADKLVITKIDIGKEETIQIVTGATNLFVGAYVPVALDGSTLANDVKIKKGKLRGEVSDGMLCAIEELGFTKNDYPECQDDGIYIFADKPTLGADVKEVLQLCDDVVEFEITSNRPDCFSVLGIARETAATYSKELKLPTFSVMEKADGDITEMISVEIKNPILCPRYAARVVKNVKIEHSPLWLRHRLTMAGIRPINNIVDITNYVMLEYGQPMHAFDIDNITDKKIIIRNAFKDEAFVTLDGEERKLTEEMLVIADCEKAVAIAGIMGGENSKITGTASAILFESANFNGVNVRKSSKVLGLRTDASSKFEKGIDPELVEIALNRAVSLVEELCCGDVVAGMVDCYPTKRVVTRVEYSADRINRLLGTDITKQTMVEILQRLDIQTEGNFAIIPTSRPDLLLEADIAEEVARIYGYNNIKATLASGTPTVGKKSKYQLFEDVVLNHFVSSGFCEALSYAFESPKVFDKLLISDDSDLRKVVKIINPLGEDFSIMRTTTLNSMLQSLSTNFNRRNDSALLFEIAKIYTPKQLPMLELPTETQVLTVGMYGTKDFYDLKGVLENLEDKLGFSEAIDYSPMSDLSFMHSGVCANLTLRGKQLGFIGEIHPAVQANYEIGKKVYVAYLEMAVLFESINFSPVYKPIAKFPNTTRDIAVVVDASVIVKDIEFAIKEKGGKSLESVVLFDIYQGDNIGADKKSVAYSLSFRAADRTLTEEEVSSTMKKIVANLELRLSAVLRA